MSESRRVSRRVVLRGLVGGVVGGSALSLLAACGGGDDDEEPTSTAGSAGSEPTAEPETDSEPTPEADPEVSPQADPEAESGSFSEESLIVYSGRNENLVGPILERFQEDTGIEVSVQYASTSELAATLLEEGENTPADVYFAQDAGALGAVSDAGMFAEIPQDLLDRVESRFRSQDGLWIGISGRARTVVYNTDALSEADIPSSILDFTNEEWSGKLGWAPTNASFQSFVTALRVVEGEDAAREWLEGIRDNDTNVYPSNTPIVAATIDGEIQAGFVNHYYLYRAEAEAGGEVSAANYWYTNGDPGALINVAGVGILQASDKQDVAQQLVDYFLSEDGQNYFAGETFEYPLVTGVEADPRLVPLSEIQTPDIDLSDLDDLEGTLELLRDVGLL